MGTQDRPASSVLRGPCSHNVFLLVVVDRRDETWFCLLRWSVERSKTETVRLGTAGKHDALKRHIARGESVERIFQHSGIWLDSFSHGGFLDIGSEDQIGHLIKRLKCLCRALAVHQIHADVRGSGLSPIGRRGSACSCGDSPSWVLCDGVDNTRTKDAIGSHNQDLALRDGCFRSSGHGKVSSFQVELIKPSTELESKRPNHPNPNSSRPWSGVRRSAEDRSGARIQPWTHSISEWHTISKCTVSLRRL